MYVSKRKRKRSSLPALSLSPSDVLSPVVDGMGTDDRHDIIIRLFPFVNGVLVVEYRDNVRLLMVD